MMVWSLLVATLFGSSDVERNQIEWIRILAKYCTGGSIIDEPQQTFLLGLKKRNRGIRSQQISLKEKI